MRDAKFNELFYDAASITVATGQTNRDIKANESELWKTLTDAYKVVLSTDQTITVRFNDTSYGGIVVTSSESPKVFDAIRAQNMYITNASGSVANIKVELYS